MLVSSQSYFDEKEVLFLKSKISKNDNMLDLVPLVKEKIGLKEAASGIVTLVVPRDGFFDKIARLFCKTPKEMNIELDSIGSFVIKSIDGQNSIYEIGSLLKSEFGKDIEPIYERLLMHINILRNNNFIHLEKASDQNA